ncbi:hypothetical protein RUND412_008529 [Rhizina undulata]
MHEILPGSRPQPFQETLQQQKQGGAPFDHYTTADARRPRRLVRFRNNTFPLHSLHADMKHLLARPGSRNSPSPTNPSPDPPTNMSARSAKAREKQRKLQHSSSYNQLVSITSKTRRHEVSQASKIQISSPIASTVSLPIHATSAQFNAELKRNPGPFPAASKLPPLPPSPTKKNSKSQPTVSVPTRSPTPVREHAYLEKPIEEKVKILPLPLLLSGSSRSPYTVVGQTFGENTSPYTLSIIANDDVQELIDFRKKVFDMESLEFQLAVLQEELSEARAELAEEKKFSNNLVIFIQNQQDQIESLTPPEIPATPEIPSQYQAEFQKQKQKFSSPVRAFHKPFATSASAETIRVRPPIAPFCRAQVPSSLSSQVLAGWGGLPVAISPTRARSVSNTTVASNKSRGGYSSDTSALTEGSWAGKQTRRRGRRTRLMSDQDLEMSFTMPRSDEELEEEEDEDEDATPDGSPGSFS